MRLLIYLLALLTGFSAAEAARPLDAGSASASASQFEQAESVALVAVSNGEGVQHFAVKTPVFSDGLNHLSETDEIFVDLTPVTRSDTALE